MVATYCLLLLPRLHCRFVFLKLVTPVGVNFLIVIAFVRCSTSVPTHSHKKKGEKRENIQLFLLQFFFLAPFFFPSSRPATQPITALHENVIMRMAKDCVTL